MNKRAKIAVAVGSSVGIILVIALVVALAGYCYWRGLIQGVVEGEKHIVDQVKQGKMVIQDGELRRFKEPTR